MSSSLPLTQILCFRCVHAYNWSVLSVHIPLGCPHISKRHETVQIHHHLSRVTAYAFLLGIIHKIIHLFIPYIIHLFLHSIINRLVHSIIHFWIKQRNSFKTVIYSFIHSSTSALTIDKNF